MYGLNQVFPTNEIVIVGMTLTDDKSHSPIHLVLENTVVNEFFLSASFLLLQVNSSAEINAVKSRRALKAGR